MRRKVLISVFTATIALCFLGISVYGNVDIFNQHKTFKSKGKILITSCKSCHNNDTKLDQKKGRDYKKLYKTRSCKAPGCHK